MDLLLRHSSVMDMSRRHRGRAKSVSFPVPLMSEFHGYHDEQCGGQHQQLSCDTASYQETQHQTDDSDENDDYSSRGTDYGIEVNDDRSGKRRGADNPHDVATGDHGGPVSQLTSRKQDYSVAELLRNDRPSSSAMYDDHTDSRRHSEARTSPSKTADSAFHSWNVEPVDRPIAPLPLPLAMSTTRHHRWTDWMMSDSWRCPKFDNGAHRRCFGLFDTPPVNFVPTLRRATELQLSLSTFRQQYSVPRRSRNCQLMRT